MINANKSRSRLAYFALALLLGGLPASAQKVNVYRQLPSVQIRASASSSIDSSPASQVVDGSGMRGEMHVANNLGEGMWVSEVSRSNVRYSSSTKEGAVWFLCELGDGRPVMVDQIRLWNHNQNEHTRRGLNKVYMEYSVDGKEWNILKNGQDDFHMIPEAVGKNPEPADYVLDIPSLKLRYLCITAAGDGLGNHYDRTDPVVMREAADMRQNPDYYGLAEMRFYRREARPLSEIAKVSDISFSASQGYLKTPDGPSREFHILFDVPVYAGTRLSFSCGEKTWNAEIGPDAKGVSRYDGLFPAGYMEETSKLKVTVAGRQGQLEKTFDVPAARKWTVCFFPHSHLDIGYTHRQDDVMRLQWRNMERAMELAERTKDYPDGARYCWNSEVTWPVMGYLQEYAGTEKADRLIEAIRNGVINVDASLGSILTGISRQEELNHYFDDAHKIEEMTGVGINTAMMSDVPGQVWGLATALSDNGVKYFSPGPNYVPFYGKIGNDRAAAIHIKWGDRPFYWQSQSGTDKVLVWSAGRGYSWFHGWLAGRLSVCGLEPIWMYLQELETDEFPYRMCYLRYTVHGDNGPPDELMPEVIREWNEKYDSPQFRISTSKEFFTEFEKEYGDVLPVYGGDMTPTWEDGAASTAAETAMNRESAARLARTGTLWSMLSPSASYPFEKAEEAWKNVVLFSEHTWGAAGSGPEPDSQFTKELWAKKKAYADSADVQSRRLECKALSAIEREGNFIHVINTNLWNRTDIVYLDRNLAGKVLVDGNGKAHPVQKLSCGRWAFVAVDVPAMSSSVYRIADKPKTTCLFEPMVHGNVLDNGLLRAVVDTVTGTVTSLTVAGDKFEYAGGGLNGYLYTARIGKDPRGIEQVCSVEVIDNGPVAATVRVVSDAPGCKVLWRDMTIYRGIDRLDIVNTIDKEDIREFENVRFVFPFNFPHPEISMDLAMSEIHPEREQLAGVNKHYYSVQNGLSVGDLEHGICLTTVDAPFVELGTPSGEDYKLNHRHGYGWWQTAQISPVIYSWVMTNTWRTNYKASQSGKAVFRYSLQPGNPHDLKLKQRGLDREQELVAVTSTLEEPVGQLFRLKGRHRIAVSEVRPSKDGQGYIVRLQNMGGEPVKTSFVWGTLQGKDVSECDWRENSVQEIDPSSFWLKPYEYKVLKVK